MKSSYKESDVEILLKDISGLIEPLPAEIREKNIQTGTHYCEMLPLEYQPSEKYMNTYKFALEKYAKNTADAIAIMSEKIFKKKGKELVIVSLARAGIPIGILSKRYIEKKYKCNIFHYSISIIRDKGIDDNAMKYILNKHSPENIQFLDGWIGKGTIFYELYNELEKYPQIEKDLAVVSDPANITKLCGTHEDILIPSSCLNAIVTGLISRTFLRSDIIGKDDFHGAVYYENMEKYDLSNEFLDLIESKFDYELKEENQDIEFDGRKVVKKIAGEYNIDNINLIKIGIGETTRVLLRRIPWKILINKKYNNASELNHILQLAEEKNVPVEICNIDMGNYKACGIIKKMSDI